ncbi:MAG: PAS domain S-box protein [Desulfatiglandales bacterium]
MTKKPTYEELEGRVEELEKEAVERKLAEDAPQRTQKELETIVDSVPAMIFYKDKNNIMLRVNETYARSIGISKEYIEGKSDFDLTQNRELAERYWRDDKEVMASGIPKRNIIEPLITDETRWVQTDKIPYRDDEGNIQGIIGFSIDITSRVRAEEALRESEERYRSLVENVPIAVYRTIPGPKGRFLMANPTFLKMFGLNSEEELKEITVADVYMNPKDRKAFSDNLLARGIATEIELPLKKKDGTTFWGSVTAKVVYDEGGKALYFDCTIVDITAQRQAEEEKEKLQAQFFQAQKVEAIGTLAGGIAHNFNNLLMGIMGNTSLMFLETDPAHPNYERLKHIEKSVQSGSKLTSQLLGYAREGGYEIAPISLNQLVRDTSDTLATTKKEIRVHQDLPKDLFGIKADHGQIEQVLMNLYVNAADAMPGGGDLFLKTMNVTHKQISDRPYKPSPGNYVLLTVRDTGMGMDKKTQDRVFDPFFTTKDMGKGTGLGLASVYGIIKAHGGYIDVESKKGHGATFSIYLPASHKKVLITEKRLPEKILKGKETILLVDDEDMIIDVGQEVLRALGYRVLIARGGKEAVELYKKNWDKIDMVLLDMVMPDMGGGETYDRMREINPDIKVLLLSGYSIDGQAKEILDRGCDGFIQKPFNMRQLSQMIKDVLDKS